MSNADLTPRKGRNSKINSPRAGSLFLAPFFRWLRRSLFQVLSLWRAKEKSGAREKNAGRLVFPRADPSVARRFLLLTTI